MSQFVLPVNERLVLKSVHASDAEMLFTLADRHRAYLREWLPWLDFNQSVGDTLNYIETCRVHAEKNEALQCAIWWDGAIVGAIGFHRFDFANRSTSIGYWLAADAQGQGIMTRSCEALVSYAFREIKLHRVEIRCAPGNRKSRAIPERLGFQQEGILRDAEWLYDHFVDLVVYGMLASDWKR